MKVCVFLMIACMVPLVTGAASSRWNGGQDYFTDPGKYISESMANNTVVAASTETTTPPADKKKAPEESSTRFMNETIDKITALMQQIDNGIQYADEYHEKNRPVSKYVLLSYLNSMANEISNLKEMYDSGSLNDEAKKSLQTQISTFEKKYADYNRIISDFDTIEVSNLKSNMQVDVKTVTRTNVDPTNQTKNTQTTYTVVGNSIFTFTADVSNSGSKADLVIELKGLNYNGQPIATHIIRTSVAGDSKKEIESQVVLPRGVGQDITNWEISDVKIVRNRK